MELSEAQQIALESSGELLPPDNLVKRIEQDISAIRSQFPEVANVRHTNKKFQPGRVILSFANKEMLEKIGNSSYGPIHATPIFQNRVYVLQFKKPYNPSVLAGRLQEEFEVTDVEPDGGMGGYSEIRFMGTATGSNTYVFFIGSGMIQEGRINARYFKFIVEPEQKSVQMVKDVGKLVLINSNI